MIFVDFFYLQTSWKTPHRPKIMCMILFSSENNTVLPNMQLMALNFKM